MMVGAGRKIERVETTEDTIVFAGNTHEEFVSKLSSSFAVQIPKYLQGRRNHRQDIEWSRTIR
jgi:hypothetical protein